MRTRTPASRTGTVTGPRRRADGTLAYRIQWFDEDGERQSETVTGDRQAAQRRLDAHLREVELVRVGLRQRARPRAPTLTELAVRVEKEVLPTRQRPKQRLRTLVLLATWWEPAFGQRPVDEIRAGDIRAVLAGMRDAGRSPATCNRALAALSVVLSAAVEWEHIPHNPCLGRATKLRQKEGRKLPRILAADEALRLLERAEDRWRAPFGLALYGGLRWGEVQALRGSALDRARDLVLVRVAGAGDDDPKSGHQRAVAVNRGLWAYVPEPAAPGDYVCPGNAGRGLRTVDPTRPISLSGATRALKRALQAAGIDRHISVHDLRHTHATLYLEAGGSLAALQHRLGHDNVTTTSRYVHLARRRRDGAPTLNVLPEGD